MTVISVHSFSDIGTLEMQLADWTKGLGILSLTAVLCAAVAAQETEPTQEPEEPEVKKPAVVMKGRFDLLGLSGYGSGGRFGLTTFGRLTGFGHGSSFGTPVGFGKDLNIYQETSLQVSSGEASKFKWSGTLVGSSVYGAFGSQSLPGAGGFTSGLWDGYLQDLWVSFDSMLLGNDYNVRFGRVGYQIGDFILKKGDVTPAFANERWDNGDFHFDGGIVGMPFGQAKLTVFGGWADPKTFGGRVLEPMIGGVVDELLGVELTAPIGDNGKLKAAYLMQDSDQMLGGANRVNTYGAEFKINSGQISFGGKYSKTVLSRNTHTVNDTNNAAWDVDMGYRFNKTRALLGFRRVESAFLAAGSWDRIGHIWNPTGFDEFRVGAEYEAADKLDFDVNVRMIKGLPSIGNLNMTTGDKCLSLRLGARYEFSPRSAAVARIETYNFNYKVGNDPNAAWLILGWEGDAGKDASVRFYYETGGADDRGAVNNLFGGKFAGGQLAIQYSLKF